ncbi:MAG: bifunctional adenosylcobinamide kinase/adenosylcobinamide-phosphate guanylyltransferase [Dehalococcoidales bacterium]|nr:bifunctional adenosylcobinamide kinase/adenosylcobinamide-phosphate guanylyltransferase [Dehalococcoidales bacterium]
MSCILITGGARAGKSGYAQKLAIDNSGKVLFVATAEAKDEDMRLRIEKHKKSRPSNWQTLESPSEVANAISEKAGEYQVIVIDCITMLVSNVMLAADDEKSAEAAVINEIDTLIKVMKFKSSTYILVSNEVGLGIVPDNELSRNYRDLLGRANQLLARYADEVYLMVSGIPVKIK